MSKYVGHLPQSFGKDKRLFFGYAGNKNYEKNYDAIFKKKNDEENLISKIQIERRFPKSYDYYLRYRERNKKKKKKRRIK